jgi:hypothetical protein
MGEDVFDCRSELVAGAVSIGDRTLPRFWRELRGKFLVCDRVLASKPLTLVKRKARPHRDFWRYAFNTGKPNVLGAEYVRVKIEILLQYAVRGTKALEDACIRPFQVPKNFREVILHCLVVSACKSLHEFDGPADRPRNFRCIQRSIEAGNPLPQQRVDAPDLALKV